jgi:hypothetical protein
MSAAAHRSAPARAAPAAPAAGAAGAQRLAAAAPPPLRRNGTRGIRVTRAPARCALQR